MTYLENLLDILHLPLEILLAPSYVLGGRTPMYSNIWANLASGFQLIPLLGGTSSDQGRERGERSGCLCRWLSPTTPWFGKGCIFCVLGHDPFR